MVVRDIKKVACLGAGVIGSSFAANFLMKGVPVNVYTRSQQTLEKIKKSIPGTLESLYQKGLLSREALDSTANSILFTTDIETAVKDVQFIQESLPEQYELKQTVLREVEKYADRHAVIGTSTSGLLISEIARCLQHPDRFLGVHPYNPPHLIPLVEITKGEETSPAVAQVIYAFFQKLGKEPVLLHKETPGFIANRLQVAMYREVIDLVVRGVCSVEDVDKAALWGPGLRSAIMGPNLTFHLGGGEKGIKGLMTALHDSTEMRLRDMARWTKEPEGWPDIAEAGVLQEIANRPAEFGKTTEEIAALRDNMLIEILKLHKKL